MTSIAVERWSSIPSTLARRARPRPRRQPTADLSCCCLSNLSPHSDRKQFARFPCSSWRPLTTQPRRSTYERLVGAPHRELSPLSDEDSRRIVDRYIGSDAGGVDVERDPATGSRAAGAAA
jgi:hypothetical protein